MSQEFLANARSAPKRALLLAAGLGTRLRPITDHIPKCLVPIHGEPLLYRWLDLLCGSGVDEIIVTLITLLTVLLKHAPLQLGKIRLSWPMNRICSEQLGP